MKHYCTTNSYSDDRFQHFNPRSLSEFRQQLHKIFENWKIIGFLSNSVPIRVFFNLKTAINSSEKSTGQQICSLLTLLPFQATTSIINLTKTALNFRKVKIFGFLSISLPI